MDELKSGLNKPTARTAKARRRWALDTAAYMLAGEEPGQPLIPRLWSLTVFFEEYLEGGAEATEKTFGPKAPIKLKAVRDARAK